MTAQQRYLFGTLFDVGDHLFALIMVIILARPKLRRMAGALVGGASSGVAALGIIAIGEHVGWWHMAIAWEPYFLTVLWIDFTLCGFVLLITWRIARRFGWRGLAVVFVIAAVLGPVREYRHMMAQIPDLRSFAPGFAPVLGISATYVLFGVLGHGVMRLVAGPAGSDQFAGRGWFLGNEESTATV